MLRTLFGLALIWAAPAASPSREDDRAALLAIEQQWLAGAGDAETLSRILADDFVHPVPTGDMLSKAQHIRWSSAHPPPRDPKRRLEDMRVRIYGDVGIVNGTVVSGTRRAVFTDVFAFRDGRWQAVNAQENAVGGPQACRSTRSGKATHAEASRRGSGPDGRAGPPESRHPR